MHDPTASIPTGAVGRDRLADAVYRTSPGLTRNEARALVDQVLDEIVDGLAHDRKVLLSGFGAFTLVDKPPRSGRNPKTGETHPIVARTIVRFKAAGALKARVHGMDGAAAVAEDACAFPATRKPGRSSRRS